MADNNNQWQPIAACPNNTTVLFWDNGYCIGRMEHNVLRMDGTRMDHFWGDSRLNDNHPPTHWMLLPQPPATPAEGE
jgi:hypothetical protein